MKNITLFLFLTIVFSCSVSNKINWSNSFWATIETEEAYLYKLNSLTSVVDKELKKVLPFISIGLQATSMKSMIETPKNFKESSYLSLDIIYTNLSLRN